MRRASREGQRHVARQQREEVARKRHVGTRINAVYRHTLAIDATTVSHLATWKERQAEELAKIGVKQTDETPVCCSSTGGRIRIDNFSHWWGIWRKEHGFDGLKFHELRHTQATLLLANGVDVKTVQTRLGHASASITLDWYAHAIPQNDHAAATMLGNLLNAKQEEDDPKDPQENAAQTQEESFRLLPHENLPKVTAEGSKGGIRKQASSFN